MSKKIAKIDNVVVPYPTGMLFLTGNVKFIPKEGEASTAPHSSVLIAYDPPGTNVNSLSLKYCGLQETFVYGWTRCQARQASSTRNG